MKFLIVAVFLITTVFAHEYVTRWSKIIIADQEAIKAIEDQCLAKYQLDYTIINNYDHLNSSRKADVRCYDDCIYVTAGDYDKNHNFNVSNGIDEMPKDLREDYRRCGQITDPDYCTMSYKITQCFMKAYNEHEKKHCDS